MADESLLDELLTLAGGDDGRLTDYIDVNELTLCRKCNRLDQWESAASDPRGLKAGRWR